MANPIQFLKETKAELMKVVWPSKKEVTRITIVVVSLSLAVAAFLGLIDMGLNELFEWIIDRQN